MPMVFTDSMVVEHLQRYKLDTTGTDQEKRERLAKYTEEKWGDMLEAWEIRTGRGWDQMSQGEAIKLAEDCPQLARNPAVLSRALTPPNPAEN